ncbi:hypothetical protein Q5752_004900 [Cryptotrichosporon argae]
MSLRPILRQLPARPLVRGLRTTPRRLAGHDEHAHGHDHADSSANTTETFLNPTWRNTLLLTFAAVLIYPYLPSPKAASASPSLSPAGLADARKKDAPYLTRLLARLTPDAALWTERNDRHLELTKEAAGTRLLFQEAERPKVWRMRYPSAFEQASPHAIPVGSQADLSKLEVKGE